ncbi:hypothetical protein C8R43DRAFT_1021276 [Mycena crocata]|nr:hypothetical protein C8R43DRAFT_1021276 [Mycena crocata]
MADFRLLDVLPELLIQILFFLDLDDLHSCRQTCRFLSDVIETSIEIQYLMARLTAQVADNPSSTLPASERLALLHAREDAFALVNPSWACSIPVTFVASGLYELSAGFFFLGEDPRKALRYIELPSEQSASPPQWERITLSSPQSTIIDFGLAIEEHDLIVIATYTPIFGTNQGLVNMECRAMSTHLPHPQAQKTIEVHTSHWGIPNIILEIVGDHIVLVVSYAHTITPDHVYVYEWRTAKLKMTIEADCRTYFGAVFLTPEILMLPNTITATLELWTIPSEQTTPTLTLHLPHLLPGMRIRLMTARGEPNPSLSKLRKLERVPFHSTAEDSIIVFHIKFLGPEFLLFIHRRALLRLLESHDTGESCSYTEWGPDICRWLNAAGMITDWITMTSGQRCVLLPARASASFYILDFNPHTTDESHCYPPAEDPFEANGIWAEAVGSRLKCHVTGSASQFSLYNGASLDDERIIALRRNVLRQIGAVDVFYFG